MKSARKVKIVLFLLAVVVMSGCQLVKEPSLPTFAPTEVPASGFDPRIVISEVMAADQGNNDYEFIELYNSSRDAPFDLKGMTLWYQLEEGEKERILYRWTETTLVPPRGHYLLGKKGQDYQTVVDVYFDLPLAASRGGLILRAGDDQPVDSLAWGDNPQKYGEGDQARALERGFSLERKPGGTEGSGQDTEDNRADFQFKQNPQPQGTADDPTPFQEERLVISISAPEQVEPGAKYTLDLEFSNYTGQDLHQLDAVIPLPAQVEILSVSPGLRIEGQKVIWEQERLAAGESLLQQITLRAPWTYLTARVDNYILEADDWPVPALGGPIRTEIAGGSIPVAKARELLGDEVVVEGVATMYTGGYYAGSGNTKFYLEDETDGIQVWVPGGGGEVSVQIGDRVKVRGVPELYRGAVELVVNDPDQVEVREKAADDDQPQPEQLTISQVIAGSGELPGRLARVEGEITRVEEFSYSYEIDIKDEENRVLTLYVDKDTGLNIEHLEVGDHYRMTGILEVRDGVLQLYPRTAVDLEKIYPPVLRLILDAPNTAQMGEVITLTLTAYNHTPQKMTGVEITFQVPENGRIEEVLDQGEKDGENRVVWKVAELEGDGGAVSVRCRIVGTSGEYLEYDQARAISEQWEDPAEIDLQYTFAGELIPVWAIQGPGFRSPYILEQVKTAGVITGTFPELAGFWIQELDTDLDPRTSPGVFVNSEGLSLDLAVGDWVRVDGVARETYQQTQVKIKSAADVEVLGEKYPLPPAEELDPPSSPAEAEVYFESREGSLVQVTDPGIAVSPSTRYGEYVFVLAKHQIDRLWSREESGLGIMVDDGSEQEHQYRNTLPYVVKVGDQVIGLSGPLAYTYGNYKIEPAGEPVVEPVEQELPQLAMTAEDQFSVATWNVENLFDIVLPHPSSPDLPTVSEYRVDLAKVANTILFAGSPTVVGLQEVENLDILEDLAGLESLQEFGYQPYLIEGTDSRGIDVGYLIRGDQVKVEEVKQFPAPEGLTSRPPLMIKLEVQGKDKVETVIILNNHFTSMSGGEEATEPRRTAQAAWNVEVVEKLRKVDPDAHFVIMGDLNSYFDSPPLDALREAGLEHVLAVLPDDQRYNYIYQGNSQVLDHILVSPDFFQYLSGVEILHTNADFPLPLPEDSSPLRKSDHDLVLARFTLLD
ncbi:MAG: lamin tail domain-containing protein [Anaerolineales bacterium]|nr:lamin tail domain-containing protein [Anaerolineales bacterium]